MVATAWIESPKVLAQGEVDDSGLFRQSRPGVGQQATTHAWYRMATTYPQTGDSPSLSLCMSRRSKVPLLVKQSLIANHRVTTAGGSREGTSVAGVTLRVALDQLGMDKQLAVLNVIRASGERERTSGRIRPETWIQKRAIRPAHNAI